MSRKQRLTLGYLQQKLKETLARLDQARADQDFPGVWWLQRQEQALSAEISLLTG